MSDLPDPYLRFLDTMTQVAGNFLPSISDMQEIIDETKAEFPEGWEKELL